MAESGSPTGGNPRSEDDESARSEERLQRWDAGARRSEDASEREVAARERAEVALGRFEHAETTAEHSVERAGIDEGENVKNKREAMADELERMADRRGAVADERERIADRREEQADRRELAAEDDGGHLRGWEERVAETDRATKRDADEREARLDVRERLLRQEQAELDERERLVEQDELNREMDRSAELLRGSPTAADREVTTWANLVERGAALRSRAAGLAERMADQAERFAAHLQNATTPGDQERRHAIAETELEIARIERRNAAKLRDRDHAFHLDEHLPKLPDTDPTPESDPEGGPPGTAG